MWPLLVGIGQRILSVLLNDRSAVGGVSARFKRAEAVVLSRSDFDNLKPHLLALLLIVRMECVVQLNRTAICAAHYLTRLTVANE